MLKHTPDAKEGGSVEANVDFQDSRGDITNLFLEGVTSISELTSLRSSVRANHYHKTDWHYAYVVLGSLLYFERAVGTTDIPQPMVFKGGDIFFTPPNREHAMLFTDDSVILTFARNRRDHESHEADVVRVDFITPAVVADLGFGT